MSQLEAKKHKNHRFISREISELPEWSNTGTTFFIMPNVARNVINDKTTDTEDLKSAVVLCETMSL